MNEPIKRFIAGAVCPSCSQMDKLVMYLQDEVQIRECVRCGYSDQQDENGNISEIKTRVNQPRAGEKSVPGNEDVQVLSLGTEIGKKTIH
jgi:uncharacterized metal-binding protein (TIGR02443 family)